MASEQIALQVNNNFFGRCIAFIVFNSRKQHLHWITEFVLLIGPDQYYKMSVFHVYGTWNQSCCHQDHHPFDVFSSWKRSRCHHCGKILNRSMCHLACVVADVRVSCPLHYARYSNCLHKNLQVPCHDMWYGLNIYKFFVKLSFERPEILQKRRSLYLEGFPITSELFG